MQKAKNGLFENKLQAVSSKLHENSRNAIEVIEKPTTIKFCNKVIYHCKRKTEHSGKKHTHSADTH